MAIDDNTSYELTGYQVKDLAQKIRAKADASAISAVGYSNLYSDLTGTPTIPTVYNGRLTIQHNGSPIGAFSANQSSDGIIKINTLRKVTVFLFCGYVNYAIYGGKNETYNNYIGKFYERLGDPVNTTEISYDDVRALMDDSNVDLEIIGFVRNDVYGRMFHQISDDSYDYNFDTETESLSIVICGVDVTEAAMTSFREQITFDYSAYASQQHATIVGRKALTPLVIYFDNTLPIQGDLNASLPFLSLADLAVGTTSASTMNAEYVSVCMAQYVYKIDGCELEWRVVSNGNVVKSYRVDAGSSSYSLSTYHLYDYDYATFNPVVTSYESNVQYLNFESSWTPSSSPSPSSGPEVITWLTNADLTTSSSGQSAGLYGPSTPPTTVNGFVEVMDKFLNNGAIITLSDTTNFSVWFRGTTACRITRVGVDTVNGSPVLNFYFDGPGTVKRIQVATTYGSDPVTVTLEA